MIDFTNSEECQITASRIPELEKTRIQLKITDGKFNRWCSFQLTDEERIRFATELLELT